MHDMENVSSSARRNDSSKTRQPAPVVAAGDKTVCTQAVRISPSVEIARIALRRINENGLAPTPESYVREYRRAAGLASDDAVTAYPWRQAAHTVEMVRAIIQVVTEATAGLAVGLDQFDSRSKRALSNADPARESDELAHLLRTVTGSAMSMIRVIESSQSELSLTRRNLERAHAELEQTHALARTDALTGFCNRRAMQEIIAREIARACRTRMPFALAILDIDHFKRVNDQYGHEAGDKALIHVAGIAKSRLRETDEICRYGGEEFVITLPGADATGAQLVMDRMRMAVEAAPLVLALGPVVLRFSAGVAELAAQENMEGLLRRADAALYQAKRCGRNRVLIADASVAA